MNDFIGDRNCVTHHYACDCREENFTKIEKENRELKEQLAKLQATPAPTKFTADMRKLLNDHTYPQGDKRYFTELAEACTMIDTLTAEKGMADMGFVSEGAGREIERLTAENKKLRTPIEVAGFKANGLMAIGQELISRATRIERLEGLLREINQQGFIATHDFWQDRIEHALSGQENSSLVNHKANTQENVSDTLGQVFGQEGGK